MRYAAKSRAIHQPVAVGSENAFVMPTGGLPLAKPESRLAAHSLARSRHSYTGGFVYGRVRLGMTLSEKV